MPLANGNRLTQIGIMSIGPSWRGLVPPFIAMDVLRAANAREATGERVIHLEVGQPGTAAPRPVLDAARQALSDNRIGYTDAEGITPLRQTIAEHYRAQYGVAVDPAEIVVTTGSSAAFQLAFLAAFEAGDRVALAAPGYPAYRNILSALGLETVLIEVGENAHYQPNPELLADIPDLPLFAFLHRAAQVQGAHLLVVFKRYGEGIGSGIGPAGIALVGIRLAAACRVLPAVELQPAECEDALRPGNLAKSMYLAADMNDPSDIATAMTQLVGSARAVPALFSGGLSARASLTSSSSQSAAPATRMVVEPSARA